MMCAATGYGQIAAASASGGFSSSATTTSTAATATTPGPDSLSPASSVTSCNTVRPLSPAVPIDDQSPASSAYTSRDYHQLYYPQNYYQQQQHQQAVNTVLAQSSSTLAPSSPLQVQLDSLTVPNYAHAPSIQQATTTPSHVEPGGSSSSSGNTVVPFRRASESGHLIVERSQGTTAAAARAHSIAAPHWQRPFFPVVGAGGSCTPSALYSNVVTRLYITPSSIAQTPSALSSSSSSSSSVMSDTSTDAAGATPHALQRGASADSETGYVCRNCGKAFARDDLLRRHLAREARAAAQPSLDRQKSCFECARSKARCDLEVPACGRCRARGKTCMYGARSGNPNVRKPWRGSSQDLYTGGSGGTPRWASSLPDDAAQHWPSAGITVPSNTSGSSSNAGADMYAFPKNEGSVSEDYESDDSHQWSDSYQQYRGDRTLSTSSSNTTGSYDYPDTQQHQHDQPVGGGAFSMGNASAQTPYGMAAAPVRATTIDTNVLRSRIEDDEATPVSRAMNAAAVMGPPQMTTTTRVRTAADDTASNSATTVASLAAAAARPYVPRLLTGARMPRPPEAGQASARPLFSAQLDLSGWLEEPVIPSPLYRMGPSLSALGAASGAFALPTPTSMLAAGHANGQLLGNSGDKGLLDAHVASSDTIMGNGPATATASQHAQVAARNWWSSGPPHERTGDAQEVAQACAGHFTLYPALMVLPDATSPVPPLFHRPWLARTRLDTPASLAHVRIAMAAHHVRLPASEAMMWDIVRAQAQAIVGSYETLVQASDLEVHASTAALWFLIILLLMSSDPTTGKSVDESLTDACLLGLSHLSRLLLQRVQAHEHRQAAAQATGRPSSFIEWGFVETMRRTLFACYALFVLQRFRETSHELQSRLAGAELVLDIKLPATASEFEAGTELEWRAAQHVKISDGNNSTSTLGGEALTLRELLQARTAEQQQRQQRQQQRQHGNAASREDRTTSDDTTATADDDNTNSPITDERKKQMLAYFDRHDDFTNVCLTVTFALDARI